VTGLAAGASKTASIHVPRRQLQCWSTTGGWTTETGTRTLCVSTSEHANVLQAGITVTS
jgi:hypothetical protein